MDYLEDFSKFNMKNKLDAKDYVEMNIGRLIPIFHMEDTDQTQEEKEQTLIEYFTRFPDQIKRVSIDAFGVAAGNVIPKTNNIGGTIKYR